MDRHELNEMFDGLAPDPKRERELLEKLLQDDARRNKPMKNWKRVVVGAAAAALLVTAATAAVAPGLSRKLLDYLGIGPENTQAVELLAPGAMAVDITKEDNGAVLHVTQVLRDRTSIMVLAEFIAPEGTVLNMGDQTAPGSWMRKGFNLISEGDPCFMDEAGTPIDGALISGYNWEVLEDADPLDNRIDLMLTLYPLEEKEQATLNAAALQIPAENLSYFDAEGFESEAVYFGDWTVQVPLPQRDIGYVQQINQIIGELDGSTITAGELYLTPMTFELGLEREGGLDFGAVLDEEGEAAYSRWLSIGNNVQRLTLTTGDGETIPLELRDGGWIGSEEKVVQHHLAEITDPAKFQGGTLTLEWEAETGEIDSASFPLDDLMPVEP